MVLRREGTMDASFRAFRDCVSAQKTFIAATVIGGLLVVQFWSWFLFLLWLIPHIFVALLGLVHGAGLTLCQGKENFEGKIEVEIERIALFIYTRSINW